MRRLFAGLVTSACLILMLLCAGAMAYGRNFVMPEDGRVNGFDRCDGAPCIVGITPGQTGWEEAHTVLASAEGIELTARRIIMNLPPGAQVEFYPSVDGTSVGRMYVTFAREKPLTAGWLVQRYGRPCGITFYPNNLATIRYTFLLANVRLQGKMLELDMPVTSIQFSDPAFKSETQPNPCVDNITSNGTTNRGWYGFSSVRFYLAQLH